MNFKDIILLLYIDRGFCGKQPSFLKSLLQNSVENPEVLSFSDSTYKSYFTGNPLTELAPALIKANLSKDKISTYIENLYETKFKTQKTQKIEYKDKTYKQALYVNVKDKFTDITSENMADKIAEAFYSIIKNEYNKLYNSNKDCSSGNSEELLQKIINSYTIKDNEKEAMKNSCERILDGLENLKKTSRTINNKTAIIRRGNDDKDWIEGLESSLADHISEYREEYNKLKVHYSDLSILLNIKRRLNESIKDILKTAKAINDNEYLISQEDPDYSDMESKLSDLEKEIKRFLVWLDSI